MTLDILFYHNSSCFGIQGQAGFRSSIVGGVQRVTPYKPCEATYKKLYGRYPGIQGVGVAEYRTGFQLLYWSISVPVVFEANSERDRAAARHYSKSFTFGNSVSWSRMRLPYDSQNEYRAYVSLTGAVWKLAALCQDPPASRPTVWSHIATGPP